MECMFGFHSAVLGHLDGSLVASTPNPFLVRGNVVGALLHHIFICFQRRRFA